MMAAVRYSILLGIGLILLSSCKRGYEYKYQINLLVEYRNSLTGYSILKDLPIYKEGKQIKISKTDKKYVEYRFINQDMHHIYSTCDLLGNHAPATLLFSALEEIDVSSPKHTRSYQVYLKLPTIFGSEHTEEFEISYEVKHRIGTPRYAKYKGEILKTCPMENTSEIDALYRSGKAFAVFSKSSFIKLVIPVDTAGIKPK